jgi:hypothetical protein
VTGGFFGVVLLLNLVAFIVELAFMIPFGGMTLTIGFFALLIWALYKATISLFDEEN